MSKSSFPNQSTSTLSIGNVVSAGLRIYRDNFKLYFALALQAYFWIFIPVYGWAKFSAILGQISRLAFKEVIERPEASHEAYKQTDPKKWTFWVTGLLVALILIAAMTGVIIVFAVIFRLLGSIIDNSILLDPSNSSFLLTIFSIGLLGIIAFIVFMFGYIWLFSRLSIVELPIAIENQIDSSTAISRSWNLTKGSVLRLQGIFFVAFLITLPISIVVQIVSTIIQIVLGLLFPNDSPEFALLYFVLFLGLSVSSGALLIPFWQSIKSVIYYDLLSRKEGIGLEIRDQ